jgi:amino acid transporter
MIESGMRHGEALPELPQPAREIGRWSMVALALNSIVGSGIFGLPAVLAGLLGGLSSPAMLLGGLITAVIVACYAEVASQFNASGGTYLYLQSAFGRLAGIESAWLMLLSRLTACAGSTNLVVAYLAEFWPAAEQPLPHLCLVTAIIGTLALFNLIGVGAGARLGNAAIAAKLGVLAFVIAVGAAHFVHHPALPAPPVHAGAGRWLDAMLLLLFAYGGYEVAVNPMGEARNPKRDAPFALLTALAVVTLLYSALQAIVMSVLPDAAHSTRPLADVARILVGGAAAGVVAAGALASVYGYLSANLLSVPRLVFALADRGDFPAVFARVHRVWRTPYVSILAFAAAVWACALAEGFAWNITLSAIARLLYYGALCAAVPVLRARHPDATDFRIPGGRLLPALGVLFCLALGTRADFGKSLILAATLAIGLANWAAVRRGR